LIVMKCKTVMCDVLKFVTNLRTDIRISKFLSLYYKFVPKKNKFEKNIQGQIDMLIVLPCEKLMDFFQQILDQHTLDLQEMSERD